MTKYEVLNQLNNNEIDSTDAYNQLFQTTKERKPRRAGFIKVRIRVPDSKRATFFLGILLFLPMPLFLVKLFIPKKIKNKQDYVSEQLPMAPKDIIRLISMRGVKIDIKTHDHVKVFIKTI